MYFIGIDIGTTNCKICLFRYPSFDLIKKYTFRTPKIIDGKYSEFDLQKLWENIKRGLKEISNSIDNPDKIVNISIASVGESGTLIDRKGDSIGPAITWYDTRTIEQLNHILSIINREEIFRITGLPAHSNYGINKILWIKERYENEFNHANKWLCIAEYFAYKLTGEMYAESSLASRTMALNILNREWSEELIAKVGLSKQLFPPIVQSGRPIGSILKALAKEINLSPELTVSIAGHDHMVGSTALGLKNENQILNSIGTTEGILILKDSPTLEKVSLSNSFSNGIHVLPNLFTIYSSLPASGYSLEWFIYNFIGEDVNFNLVMNKLYEKYNSHEPSYTRPIFIPHIRGSGPPKRNINSKGLFYGIGDTHSKYDLLQSVIEGLCFELKILLETIEQSFNKKYDEVIAMGSATRNNYWMQLKADILNKAIVTFDVEEPVAKGAAIIAAYNLGYKLELEQIVGNNNQRFIPNNEKMDMYKGIYDIYKEIFHIKMEYEKKRLGEYYVNK